MKFVMGKTVLITGANSLLGTHTICELLSAGYAVRGLLRCLGSYVGVEDPALELVEGEFTDRETLRRAMGATMWCIALPKQGSRVLMILTNR